MTILEFEGINSLLVEMAQHLMEHAVPRKVRGYQTYEINHPIILKMKNPLARHITISERGWNHILPYAESLWIASGRNDMQFIGKYLKRLYDYSDDGERMRAGYGPRLRSFNGLSIDYKKPSFKPTKELDNDILEIDQYLYIEKAFRRDPFTRQAIITITDPPKDLLSLDTKELKQTKDFPCTNNLHFVRKNDSLDLYVHMRSNDFFWGATGVNIFNFTLIQEYFSQILGLQIGEYYHIVNNLHYYEPFADKICTLSKTKVPEDFGYQYNYSFKKLSEFDNLVAELSSYEEELVQGSNLLFSSKDDFFNDWGKVLYSFHKKHTQIDFKNPVLNLLHERKLKKEAK